MNPDQLFRDRAHNVQQAQVLNLLRQQMRIIERPPPQRKRKLENVVEKVDPQLGKKLYKSRDHGFMTDMKLIVRPNGNVYDKVEIDAHKLILVASSPVIGTLLEERWSNGLEAVVEMPSGIQTNSVEQFLKVIYTEEMDADVDLDIMLEVIFLLDHYGVNALIPVVDGKLIDQVEPEFAVHIFEYTKVFCGVKSTEKALRLIYANIKETFAKEEYKSWSEQIWRCVLNLKYLKRVEEIDLFRALLGWRNHDMENRSETFQDLFKLIRIPLIGAKNFADFVVPSEVLPQDEILKYFSFFSGAANTHGIETKPRNVRISKDSAKLIKHLEISQPGDIIQLCEALYVGPFTVTKPRTIIRGLPGGKSVIEFSTTKINEPGLYVMGSASETIVEDIKFCYKGPEGTEGTGINFGFDGRKHIAKNLEKEGPGPCIRVFGDSSNLKKENILGEVIYASPMENLRLNRNGV